MSIYSKEAKLFSPYSVFHLDLLNHKFGTHGSMCLSVSGYILKTLLLFAVVAQEKSFLYNTLQSKKLLTVFLFFYKFKNNSYTL